ncbi:MAG: glycosyltransferase, partial [Solirubrobacterales bacterium]|nr:glycosyltransferase [Solirubrobacterales bacterium]
LAAYAGLRSGMSYLQTLADFGISKFYGGCDVVLSPSEATDGRLEELGIESEKVGRWDRGVDLQRFDPALRDRAFLGGNGEQINVLYAGRLTKEKGVELLADSFLLAREADPRLHLVLAGGGPEEDQLRERLGSNATFLGWQYGKDLARVYASADMFLFASVTDTFGNVVLEAQASGLPVIATTEGGPATLIDNGETGLLAEPTPEAMAAAVGQIVASDLLAERLRRAALSAVRERSWDASMERLANGYRRALSAAEAAAVREVA